MSEKKNYVTAHEIDGHKGIKSPHARELEAMGKGKAEIFLNQKKRRIKILVEEQFQGLMENLGFDEDYTLTFEYFPEVKVHMLYNNYEEDEPFVGAELKFLFSGERVKWIPTEDLIGIIEATLNYLECIINGTEEHHTLSTEKSDLLQHSIQQRSAPFLHLKSEHLEDLATFVGGQLTRHESSWELSKTFFQGFIITLIYDEGARELDLKYTGENLPKLNNYARDQLGIFIINHCLRFISVTYSEVKMLKIVGQMFSYSYLRSKNFL